MVNLEARLKRGQNKGTALGRKCSNIIFRVTIFIVCVLVYAHVHTEASMSDLLFLSLPYSMKHVFFWLGWKLASPSDCPVPVSYSAGVTGASEALTVLQTRGPELRPSRLRSQCSQPLNHP